MNRIAPRRSRTSSPRKLLRGTALATLVALVAALLGPATASAAPIEDYADYDGQETCADEVLPGTDFLLRWLTRQYPGTRYTSTLRACTSGTSEHKDGRALDWGADVTDPEEQAQVDAFLERVFATDKRGNEHALARRMGIMYLIWNDHIYSAYNGFEKRDYTSRYCNPDWSKCSKTTRHRDHVHISLSRSGAAAQTSFYRFRNVPSVPVLFPRTIQLDPVNTAVVKLTVPADASTVVTDFKLKRGLSYRLVADGRFRYGPGWRVGDANCRWRNGDWRERDNTLLVNGTSPWTTPCDGRHTHEAVITPETTDFLRLTIADRTTFANEGAVDVYLLREDIPTRYARTAPLTSDPAPRPWRRAARKAEPLQKERRTLVASRRGGVLTRGALRGGDPYRVVIRGTASNGGVLFDGNCVRYARRLREQHTFNLATPEADHLAIYVQGRRLKLRAPASDGDCDGENHRYVGRFRAPVDGRARIRIWDPFDYSDNDGALTVRLIHKG
jgi:hypothetical protein